MTTVIVGARLVDGTGGRCQEDMVVVVEGEKIASVGPQGHIRQPAGEPRMIRADGRTVLPGLIDAHGGIAGMTQAERPYGQTEKNIAASVIRGVRNGRLYLDKGVTTVRVDTCGHHGIFALKDAFACGLVEGPRLLVPGRGICVTGGHASDVGCYEADGPDGVRKGAREQLRAGADWVKLMVTGGAGSPSERLEDNQMTFDEIRAAVEEAHARGKPVFAHTSCAEAVHNCVAAGVDSIEHGHLLNDEVVREMKDRGTFLVPTLGVYHRLVERGERGEVPEYMYRKAKEVVSRHQESFQMALKAGVRIVAGTDAGPEWYPSDEGLFFELEKMHQAGMTAMETLMSATSRSAELLRLEDRIGTIEAGKLADLLIVDGDPLSNIADLSKTWMVFKGGRVVFER